MTKTGKPDTYWADICTKYAQGQFHFSTGKRPGAKKWKKALEEIDACPLQTNTKDLFGRSLRCSCGFHKPADQLSGACSSKAGEVETEAGAVRGDAETRRRSGSMVVLWFQSSPHLGNLLGSALLWSIYWPRPTEVTCLLQSRCLKSPRRCLRRTRMSQMPQCACQVILGLLSLMLLSANQLSLGLVEVLWKTRCRWRVTLNRGPSSQRPAKVTQEALWDGRH
ncbi:uncharacterized protein LOC109139207 [Larimichthys crocea]|uniref:uncharacterized protein LOC109139207 n=1 Tax=Larimichthys crocea TaxID=215358 RepID=UPI000F5DDFA5|nr:uncharacterized protein LOC109139207 [Larimichthys crocea]